jgi:hypothetical protein
MLKKCGAAGQAADDNIIRRVRFACWINKATDTYSEYETRISFLRRKWLRERASIISLYVRCLGCCTVEKI